MSYLEIHPLAHSTIQSIYSEWDSIVRDPSYQRNSDIWPLEKKQLLIDSIINRYDLPKIYFHRYDRKEAQAKGKQYAIIDGRQRLETIVQFMEGSFRLDESFEYREEPKVKAGGLTYSELALKYPRVKSRFDSFSLPIMTVETDDFELVEDMFSRLNEAVPLNAAEKRRAIGGVMVRAIDQVGGHKFFTHKVKFSNKRYQHKEVAVRLLFLAKNLGEGNVVDTKKPFLDAFAFDYRQGRTPEVRSLKAEVEETLESLTDIFLNKDPLLDKQATVPIYFFVFRRLETKKRSGRFTRNALTAFNLERADNRILAEKDITKATFELLEYDRLSQQGTNDASSMRERWRILENWLLTS